jgi:Predicted acetyltransferase
MDIIIRPVNADELERCAQVIREAFGTVAEDFGLTMENCPTNGAFIQAERLVADLQKGNLMFGLFAANEMIGFIQLERGREGAVILEKLAVLPAYRHRGCGKMLLDDARAKAKELGADRLLAAIIEENAVLRQWYLDNGFIHTGTKVFAHLPFTVGFLEAAI